MMKKLMNILVLSCKKATELIEKRIHFSLNPIESVQLFFHASMCDACKNYQKQSTDLDDLLSEHSQIKESPSASNVSLSEDVKARILKKLEEKK